MDGIGRLGKGGRGEGTRVARTPLEGAAKA